MKQKTDERLQVNVRLERDLVEELDEMAQAESLDRTELARRLLRDGLRRERLELAIGRYRAGAISSGRAAEIAHVSLYEMIDRIHEDGIPYEIDPAEIDRICRPAQRASAVGEARATYEPSRPDHLSGIDELRAQFRPEQVYWLFVGESSPADRTHFYRANSNLFRATQAAFAQAFGAEVPSGSAFLHYFREQGAWLVDIASEPVNRLEPRVRASAVVRGQSWLEDLIREVRPERIVITKKTITAAVRASAAAAEFQGEPIALPFPMRQWRAEYVRRLADALREFQTR